MKLLHGLIKRTLIKQPSKSILRAPRRLPQHTMPAAFKYPDVKRDDTIKTNYFGSEVTDPYQWLENPDSDETKAFVDAQNEVSRSYIDACQFKTRINKSITKLWDYPKHGCPGQHGNRFYQYKNSGLQNQSILYVSEGLNEPQSVFLDPNTLSDDGTVALSGTKFTENGATFAYGLSSSGSDWIEIKFRNTESLKDFPETLKKVKFSTMSWMHDHKGFFYCGYLNKEGKSDGCETDSNENQKLYYHFLGTDQSEDLVVLEFEDPQLRIGTCISDCGRYIIITPVKGCKNNLLYFARLEQGARITKKLEIVPIVTELDADYEFVANNDSVFIFRTNKDTPNYKLIKIDVDNPAEANWTTLIEENPKEVLDWATAVNDNQLVLCYVKDVKNVMSLHELTSGKKLFDFPLELGTITQFSGERKYSQILYTFCSFLTPSKTYKVDLADKCTPVLHEETRVGDFNPNDYECYQDFYLSKDGVTKVPIFIIHEKGIEKNGVNPCILYGYGGFNIKLMPSFSVSRLAFIKHFKGVYAVANIRGGGEYGDSWHNGGRFEQKQNCFDDFIYAAKYLFQHKYTNSKKLAIQGGSNGGLLVAACINQAPELFGAALCQVGVLDMLKYHKFTIGYAWKSDYGSTETEEGFNYIIKYSPLHNIRTSEKQYPATLLLTADHDDRVVPLHSLKFIATLQHSVGRLETQTNPLMIRVETKAGHGAGKPTAKVIDEVTDMFCFLANALTLDYSD